MERLFVDTSAWYAYANRRDPRHRPVAELLSSWCRRIVFTDYVFDELMTLIGVRVGRVPAVQVGEILRSGEVGVLVNVEPQDFEEAWRLFRRDAPQGCSFTDCASFAVMKRLKLKRAAALDDHFRQAGFDVAPVG